MKRLIFSIFIFTNSINANQLQCELAMQQVQWNQNELLSEIESAVEEKMIVDLYAKEVLKNLILVRKSCASLSHEDKKYLNNRIIIYKNYLTTPNNKQYNKLDPNVGKVLTQKAHNMEKTIMAGDKIIFTGDNDIQRSDIVLFKYPVNESVYLISRCVAVGGDIIQLIDKVLYLKPHEGDTYVKKNYPKEM